MVLILIHWAFKMFAVVPKISIYLELWVPHQELLRVRPLWMLGLNYCFISGLVCLTLLRDCACEQPVMNSIGFVTLPFIVTTLAKYDTLTQKRKQQQNKAAQSAVSGF